MNFENNTTADVAEMNTILDSSTTDANMAMMKMMTNNLHDGDDELETRPPAAAAVEVEARDSPVQEHEEVGAEEEEVDMGGLFGDDDDGY